MRTCLLVDDSSVVRKIARRIVESLDFQVVEAADGQNAMQLCGARLPDVILLDWNMPVLDGHEFIINLRRSRGGEHPKIVFCTSDSDVDHIVRALAAGAADYISKPFNHDMIRAAFQRLGLLQRPDFIAPELMSSEVNG